jgi:hypothetical protein
LSGGDCDYKALGAALEAAGWQQYSFIKEADNPVVLSGSDGAGAGALRWIVISHSCDLVHHTEQEPFVELLGLEVVQGASDEELATRSPRLMFVTAYDTATQAPIPFRARASRRVSVDRQRLNKIAPDSSISLRSSHDPEGLRGKSEHALSEWLANRYSRGWTPTEFDRRVSRNVGKIQPTLKRLHSLGVEDIFVRVVPIKELGPVESYEMHLVIVVGPEHENNLPAIQAETAVLVGHLHVPNQIAVMPPSVALSTFISYASIRYWLRFSDVFRDSLAFRNKPRS